MSGASNKTSAFMENLRQLFAECDLDGSGSLGRDEFRVLCSKIGLNDEVAEETFQRLDSDKNSQITFEEFAAGFNQYKQTSSGAAQNSTSSGRAPSAAMATATATATATGRVNVGPKMKHSPVSARARTRASPSMSGGGASTAPLSLSSTGGSGGSSSNLTASGRSTSSSGARFDTSSSYDLTSSCEQPLQLSASASASELSSNMSNKATLINRPGSPSANMGDKQMGVGGNASVSVSEEFAVGSFSNKNNDNNGNNDDMIVYSSDMLNSNENYNSGQFGSMLSSSSSYNQVKTMQDLLDCVQKLQNENQILTQIFFKDKREREEYINQLGEEFDQQLKEVEERANKRAREELEAEKRRLREMMQTERETLQHHYQTLEKMSKMVKSGGSAAGLGGDGNLEGDELDPGLFKVKSQLEDTFNENRQLKKSLLDTKTDVALIWKEMEKLKKQYEMKLSSAYEKQRETQHECDHIKKQLNLMKDSNQKLQDASDVITSYITDKVEPVIKVALDGADDSGGCPSLNGHSFRLGGSASNSRRGSILSEYLVKNNHEGEDGEGGCDSGDLESMASIASGQKSRKLNNSISASRLEPTQAGPASASNSVTTSSVRGMHGTSTKQTSTSDNPLNIPPQPNQSHCNINQFVRHGAPETKQAPESIKSVDQSKPSPIATTDLGTNSHSETVTVASSGARQGIKNIGRHFLLGGRIQSTESTKDTIVDSQVAIHDESAENKSKQAEQQILGDSGQVYEGLDVEPADGPSVATFNIILVGDSFVGKSSFAARFIEGSFVQGLISNCSIDFKTKSYKVNGSNYTVNLWDTAGQERFRSITASYFRKADGIILMYDVSDKRSYLNVRNWMSTISDTAAENVAVLLVGNKIDLRRGDNKAKCVPTEEGFRLAREYDIVFLETSVKTGTNLLPSMGRLIRLIVKNNMPEDEDMDRIRLSDKGRTFNCMPKNC